jgi:transcription antitermination protein NusB
MLSRRSVRVKVMQLLYMLNRDEQVTLPELQQKYNEGIWKTYELYIYHLYMLLKVAQYAEKDAAIRAAKRLPSDEDKHFTPHLYTNTSTTSLANHTGFLNLVEKYHLNQGIDEDSIRLLYQTFAETPEYHVYLSLPETDKDTDNKILLELYKNMVDNYLLIDLSEERYSNWSDDESLVVGAIKKSIKALPTTAPFYQEFEPTDETVRQFGAELLMRTAQEDAALLQHIEPMLKNWDAERVAILDMIMIKMALCELLHFPTIPTKVTLNEFVEISKSYSTDKSKEFINGILDRLMKKLQKEEKIVKEGRGLME